MLAERERAEAQFETLAERLEADADSAWAIFTPPTDVLGMNNGDFHEVDFFMRDVQSRPYFWAYRYDAAMQKLQRYVYSAPGAGPLPDGAPLPDVINFSAQTYPVTALSDATTPLYSSLYQNASLTSATVQFGFSGQPWIAGGNQITSVHVQNSYSVQTLQLATQTAPSGYTVVIQYTPSPSPIPPPTPAPLAQLTAMIEASSVTGSWHDCPNPRAGCSNDLWPQYDWTQTIVYRYYQSVDAGFTWSQTSSTQELNSGISTPTGGDLPITECSPRAVVDYQYECATWTPLAPPGTAGMDFSPP